MDIILALCDCHVTCKLCDVFIVPYLCLIIGKIYVITRKAYDDLYYYYCCYRYYYDWRDAASGKWHLVVWYKPTDVSEDPTT